MKYKKYTNRNKQSWLTDQIINKQVARKAIKVKEKYNHKRYWIEELDDDIERPSYKDEEE